MEKEYLTLPFVLDEVRRPGPWNLSAASGRIYGSISMHQGLDDRFSLFPHNKTVNGASIEFNIVAAGDIK